MASPQKLVVVIGQVETYCHLHPLSVIFLTVYYSAGVIGLHSALRLAEAGYEVKVIAKYIPGDFDIEYTSPWSE